MRQTIANYIIDLNEPVKKDTNTFLTGSYYSIRNSFEFPIE